MRFILCCCLFFTTRYLEETRSTLQFASRAKLVKTHAKVNEVLDETSQLKRLKKELEELKEKQRGVDTNMSDSDHAKIEAEKIDLLRKLEEMHEEKERQMV